MVAGCVATPTGPGAQTTNSPSSAAAQSPSSIAAGTPDAGPAINPPGPPEPGGAAAGTGANPLAWVPPGPADPLDPPPNGWYARLVAKECDQMPGSDPLVTAAHDLCTAVTTGEPSAWARADAGYRALPQPAPPDCLEAATYRVLASLLTYHAAHPGAPVETVPGAGTACPILLAGVTDQDGDATDFHPHVPAEGGTVLRLMGRFTEVAAVLVNGQRVSVSKLSENHFDFTAPPALQPGPATVQAVGPDGSTFPGSAEFTYDPPTGTVTPSATQPPSPAPSSTGAPPAAETTSP